MLLGGVNIYGSAAELTAETVPGIAFRFAKIIFFFTGGRSFDLSHSGDRACGIPDAGDTIVLTGGVGHNFVTRWVGGKIQSFYTTSIIRPVRLSS